MTDRSQALQDVLTRPMVWRARELAHEQRRTARQAIPTAWAGLDQALPDAGWPASGLIELMSGLTAVGEVSLLLPTLSTVCAGGQGIAVLGPPRPPYAPAWESAGIPLDRMLVINAKGGDLLWAAEQTLRSGECGAVLLWAQSVGAGLNHRALQRLHLAAGTGKALCFLYRCLEVQANPSPAPLRLEFGAGGGALQVRIVKSRGGVRTRPVPVRPFPAHWGGAAPNTVSKPTI